MTAIDLFCGMGGATQGLVQAGCDVLWALDHWSVACDAHRRWHPSVETVCASWTDLADSRSLPATGADLVWASPPCTPYSLANTTPLRGQRHPEYVDLGWLLWLVFRRIKARWLVVENVAGLKWSREGKAELARMQRVAEALKIECTVSLMPAFDFGIGQVRKRAFVVIGPVGVSLQRRFRDGAGASAGLVTGLPSRGGFTRTILKLMRAPSAQNTRHYYDLQRAPNASNRPTINDPRTGEPKAVVATPLYTLAEACELQGVPLSVVEGLPASSAFRLVGNAVPPAMAEGVVREVMWWDDYIQTQQKELAP